MIPLKRRFKKSADNTNILASTAGMKTRRDLQYREFAALLAAISSYWACTIAWGTGPAFFFFKRFDFPFPLPNIPWPLADEKRSRSAASRCHGHVHAIATRRIARPSAVGWIAIKRHTRGPPLSMKRICTHGISCSCAVIHKYRAQ